jgi:serine phosphatase RsbU (regulator of sigma subunit)
MLLNSQEKWSEWSDETKKEFTNLWEGKYTFQVKAKNLYGLESNVATYSFEILPPWYRTIYAFILYLIILVCFIYVILKIYARKLIIEKERLEKIVAERTAEVVAQNREILAQKEEIEKQNEIIVEQNDDIKQSITYASKIQKAILPPDEIVAKIFPDSFILYLPRDIVSGDFYWMTEIDNRKYCAIADCTGHSVPGGFMSMLGMSFLNEIINHEQVLSASDILNRLKANIIKSLHQTGKLEENKDGMDIVMYIIDTKNQLVQYAGANNPLLLIRNGELIIYKPDKMPVGIHIKTEPFATQTFNIQKGDILYAFSDGYVDQFGGPDNRKFMSKNFHALLLEIHQKPMPEQCKILNQTLINWMGANDRIDDIVVMGYKH